MDYMMEAGRRLRVRCKVRDVVWGVGGNGWLYLGVDADDAVAVIARIGEYGLVALDAVGMLIAEDVALARQRLVALPAAEVA